MIIYVSIVSCGTGGLGICHCFLASSGTTTNEYLRSNKSTVNKFDQGKSSNWKSYFSRPTSRVFCEGEYDPYDYVDKEENVFVIMDPNDIERPNIGTDSNVCKSLAEHELEEIEPEDNSQINSIIQMSGQTAINFTSNFYVEQKSRGAVFPEGKVQDAQIQGSLSELMDIDAEQPASPINLTKTSKLADNSKISINVNRVTPLSSP